MKDEVYEKFATKALTYLESTEAFLKDQLPDYFQQVVKYYAIQSWVFVALSVIFIVISLRAMKWGMKNYKEDEYKPEEYMPLFLGGAAVIIISACVIINNVQTGLKATIAPKVFIVDYLRGKE